MPPTAQKLQFRPRARIIRTIGDQLISGPEAAVIELVKNAYDADASFVSIKFIPPLKAGNGRIVIADDGHGMALSDIQDKWMEPATAAKSGTRLSPIKRRHMMGSKGIGRFAAAKLGTRMALNSVSDRTGSRVEVLIPELNWSMFDGDTYLSDVSIDYMTQESTLPTGTTIEISELSEDWTEPKLARLYLELRRLISPLQQNDQDKFSIYLDLSGCTKETAGFDGWTVLGTTHDPDDTEGNSDPKKAYEVQPFPILTSSDYEVSGHFDVAGRFHGTMQIRRAGQAPQPIDLVLPLQDEEQSCGIVTVQLFLFDREAAVVREAIRKAGLGDVSAAEARQILDSVAGIAIYRAGFRIRPYGDPENDWLTLDKRRVQNPSLRIGHNQIAGYVTVQDQDASGLVERSSREGFEQNAAFRRLHRLITDLLAERVEPRRQKFREDAGIARRKRTTFEDVRKISELEPLQSLISDISPAKRSSAQDIIAKQSALLVERIEALEERQRILEAQSSLGQIIGEILHEGAPSATFLANTGKRLQTRFQFLFDNSKYTEDTRKEFPEKLALVRDNGEKLRKLFEVLRPLSGARRGPPEDFYGVDAAHEVLGIFDSHNIEMEVHQEGTAKRLVGYKDDLKTALVNLVGNSIYWLEQAKTQNPRVDIRFRWQGGEAIIYVDDNGPGVPEEFAEQIFDVGFTLKDGGTGLGLNIAKEALSRSNASLHYHMHFSAGTRFEIRFPCLGG
ncbi:ATP-binding protein [Mesorhizobium sp. AA22]|uniref:sensor histidine kinase n=1 Tax=Mesorhizobium sp. AA22 TaxID=1854057 RepID=UPI0007ED3407|nr:ATP-binding protein [Mesorhizobium sp. AA22]QIA20852.1 ATP-binding protein [Mesorhizobium sp. AA22]